MAGEAPESAERQVPPGLSMKVVLLLSAAVFINFVDRGNLSTASPLLKDEFGLTNSQIGLLLSAFFWSYAPLQPVAGWLAQRYGVRYVLPGGLALWAVATIITGLVTGFALLLVLRVLLGIGESVTYPCNCALLAQRAPVHERGIANGLSGASLALGPVFGTLVGGLVMATFGWRAAFIAFGLASLVWLLPWHLATRAGETAAPIGRETRPIPYRELLGQPALWGASLGHFCSSYTFYFVLTWLPLYLVKAHGFSMSEMAKIGAGIYAVLALSATVSGWASDRWIVAGASPNRVQKTLLIGGTLGNAAVMMACASAGAATSIAFLAAFGACQGVITPNIYAISQTLGGPRAAGQWMGVQNMIGNLSGVLAPLITGFIVDRTGHFYWAFAITAAVALVGALVFGVLIRRVEPVVWAADRPVPATAPA
jgi:MFS family permease